MNTAVWAVAGFGLTVVGTFGVLLAVLRAAARDDEKLARQERAMLQRRLHEAMKQYPGME